MSAFRHFSRKILLQSIKSDLKLRPNISNPLICLRLSSHTPITYDGSRDPGPIFIKQEVQVLLKTLTRTDLAKVFRKRKLGEKLEQPAYKFMTDEQLQEAYNQAKKKVDIYLQIPPVVALRKQKNRIISADPALQGFDSSNFVFTDITYGVNDSERVILIRDTEGTLKEADWETRDRINQMYFPVAQRQVKIPQMFEDKHLEDLLARQEYIFILDRACIQFEPNDPLFQKVVSITYQHINESNQYNVVRSTRHFGGFAFFLAWNKMIDNLMLDVIESEHIEEAKALVDLYRQIHDVKLRDGDLKPVEDYIMKHSTKKAALELALQAYKNAAKQRESLQEGINRAHGVS